MKRARRLIQSAIPLACLLMSSAAGPSLADNPLPNPGFEEGESLWSVSGASQIIPGAAHAGKAGLRVGTAVYSADGASVTSARLPVTPGQAVELAFQARSRAACSGAYLWFYSDAGKAVTPPKGVNATCWISETNNVWSAHTLKTVIPAGVASVAIWVHASPGVLGTADYDDFALAGIASGAKAIPPPPPRKSGAAKKPVDPASLPARAKPPIIVIKLDDVKQVRTSVHAAWKRVDEVLAARNIKASYGVICETLKEAAPEYVSWIKTRQDSGRVEFWFHGWNHGPHDVNGKACNEFAGWPYDGMKALVDRSQKAARDKLGFAFKTFGPTGSGAPGPGMDETALRVMHDDPYVTVVLYPMPLDDMGKKIAADNKLTILDRVWNVNLESLVGVPDCQRLIDGYAANPERAYFVLQGHPAQWAGERFNEFVRILDFLVAQKAVFMTPTECAAAIKP